jgi:hypothetical protein
MSARMSNDFSMVTGLEELSRKCGLLSRNGPTEPFTSIGDPIRERCPSRVLANGRIGEVLSTELRPSITKDGVNSPDGTCVHVEKGSENARKKPSFAIESLFRMGVWSTESKRRTIA